jgi:hypothetical protein
MSNTEVEKRISVLESELALLKQKFEKIEEKNKPEVPWWKERMGIFADDPAHEEAMRLGREYRLAQREDYDKDDESNDNS